MKKGISTQGFKRLAKVVISQEERHTITYYANTNDMGDDVTDEDIQKYLEWAEQELTREFPEYEVEISDEPSLETCHTSDIFSEDRIYDFCSRLWDSYPWN